MSGINQSVVLDVSRIKVEFVDQIGNTKSVSGTGFWLTKGNIDVFVTNKHNIDPTINLGVDLHRKLIQFKRNFVSTIDPSGRHRAPTCTEFLCVLRGYFSM